MWLQYIHQRCETEKFYLNWKNGEVAKPYNWTDTEIDQLDRHSANKASIHSLLCQSEYKKDQGTDGSSLTELPLNSVLKSI